MTTTTNTKEGCRDYPGCGCSFNGECDLYKCAPVVKAGGLEQGAQKRA